MGQHDEVEEKRRETWGDKELTCIAGFEDEERERWVKDFVQPLEAGKHKKYYSFKKKHCHVIILILAQWYLYWTSHL